MDTVTSYELVMKTSCEVRSNWKPSSLAGHQLNRTACLACSMLILTLKRSGGCTLSPSLCRTKHLMCYAGCMIWPNSGSSLLLTAGAKKMEFCPR